MARILTPLFQNSTHFVPEAGFVAADPHSGRAPLNSSCRCLSILPFGLAFGVAIVAATVARVAGSASDLESAARASRSALLKCLRSDWLQPVIAHTPGIIAEPVQLSFSISDALAVFFLDQFVIHGVKRGIGRGTAPADPQIVDLMQSEG